MNELKIFSQITSLDITATQTTAIVDTPANYFKPRLALIKMAESLSPLEAEREEFGRDLQEIRGYSLRIIHIPPATDSTKCVFFFHGGGGRGCQFKHQIRTLKDKYAMLVITSYNEC